MYRNFNFNSFRYKHTYAEYGIAHTFLYREYHTNEFSNICMIKNRYNNEYIIYTKMSKCYESFYMLC